MRLAASAATAAFLLTVGCAHAQLTNLQAGYVSGPILLPETGAGAACADAANPKSFYLSAGAFNARRIYRVTFTSQTAHTFTLVADGALSMTGAPPGNNVLNNGFGDIWMLSLPDGRLIVADNDEGSAAPGGPIGECIFILTDRNGDGDFRDVDAGTGTPEVEVLVAAPILTNPGGNFTAAGLTRAASGHIHIVTSDGALGGEVLRISADGTAQNLYFNPLDYGSGLSVDSQGYFYAGETQGTFVDGTIHRLRDENADGDALDPGESLLLTGASMPAVYDLSVSSIADGERIFAATNGLTGSGIDHVGAGGALTRLCDLADFATGMAFDKSAASFAPDSGPTGQHLVVSNLSFTTLDGFYFFVTPAAAARVSEWQLHD